MNLAVGQTPNLETSREVATIEMRRNSSGLDLNISMPGPFGNLVLDLKASLEEAGASNVLEMLKLVGDAKSDLEFALPASDLIAALESMKSNGAMFHRPEEEGALGSTSPSNGVVSIQDEIARIRGLSAATDAVHGLNSTVLTFGHPVESIFNNASLLDGPDRKSQGVIWLDIDLGGDSETDQSPFHPDGIQQIVASLFPSAFNKDGNASKRGAPDFESMDTRVLQVREMGDGKFSGRVISPKLFMLVGEGMLITLHTGSHPVIESVREDLERDGWNNKQAVAGAGSVAIRLIEKVQKYNERTLRAFEGAMHKLDSKFRDSSVPLSAEDNVLLGNMGPALRYMRTQQGALIRNIEALMQAGARDNLANIFCLEQSGKALARARAASTVSVVDRDRISGVLDNISGLLGLNNTRLLEFANVQQQKAREAAEATERETKRSSIARERFWALITAATGVAFPFGMGLAAAQVYQESRDMLTLAGIAGSAALLVAATVTGALSWKRIFSSKE